MDNLKSNKLLAAILITSLVAVALACIVFFAAITVGVNEAQQNAKDTERKIFLRELQLQTEKHMTDFGSYPTFEQFELIDRDVVLIDPTGTVASEISFPVEVDTSGLCFKSTDPVIYSLGIQLRNGEWFHLGTAYDFSDECGHEDTLS